MEEVSKSIRVVKLLNQVMDAVKRNIQHQFKEMNLTGPQGMMLGVLSHCGQMKISDLSEKMGLSNSTVSGVIDRLENQGLVERIRSKEDRRVIYVNVTSEFKKEAESHFREIEKMFDDMMKKATSEELDVVVKGLDTLKRLIDYSQEDLKTDKE